MRKPTSQDLRVQFFHQRDGGGGRTARGEQVINEQHARAGLERVNVHRDRRRAVFERVILLVRFVGQLAFFADGDEAGL